MDTQEDVLKMFKQNTVDDLKGNLWLQIFVPKFCQHCKKTVKLFKDAKEQMENEKSDYRRELNKLTLVFNHLLTELKVMFKEGAWCPEFKIVKQEAREFWSSAFGTWWVDPTHMHVFACHFFAPPPPIFLPAFYLTHQHTSLFSAW